ncbi:MAG: GNAT family N-acetyltransferase [Clostridiales Family XIII bacterium]|nr:GNAT family N-acetyltransferase [Clostridiales Family XIII bacterium]
MNPEYAAHQGRLRIRPLERGDLEPLRLARNDAVYARFLTPMPEVSAEQQRAWYEAYLEDGDVLIWGIEDEARGVFVGATALFRFRPKRSGGAAAARASSKKPPCCEAGKTLILPGEAGRGFATRGKILTMAIGFKVLGMEKMDTHVEAENIASLRSTQRCGFTADPRPPKKTGGKGGYFTITKAEFLKLHPQLRDVAIWKV